MEHHMVTGETGKQMTSEELKALWEKMIASDIVAKRNDDYIRAINEGKKRRVEQLHEWRSPGGKSEFINYGE